MLGCLLYRFSAALDGTRSKVIPMKSQSCKLLLWAALAILLASCAAQFESPYQFHDTFDEGAADWVAGFADITFTEDA
jgi:hypothetical protein